MHKFNWIRLIARMFEAMAGNFAYSTDIQVRKFSLFGIHI
jgi:hypothetical protein